MTARPTGYGDYTTVIPCPACGCSSLLLFEDSVECSNCFREQEQVEVVDAGALVFDLALNRLGELVKDTSGEEARRRLHEHLQVWALTLVLWRDRTRSSDG